jgi:hypothetical protein
MRITVDLDSDLVSLLEQVRAQREESQNEVLNIALGLGLIAMTKPRKTIRTRSFNTGKCALENMDCISEVLAWVRA